MIVELLFITSLVLIAYTYAGYPVVIYLLSRLLPRPVYRADITPRVSLIIAAYNEERDIARKLENTLALDYPKEKLEIIVASDCSTDRTDEIVRSFSDRGVALHRRPERIGKSVAQNHVMKCSSGEILVFSDATTMYEPDAVRKIVRSFADPEVGCVAGQLVYRDESATAVGKGCRSYWNYEKILKDCESRLGSLIGVSGCLYAVRRSNYVRIALDMSSDFVIATEIRLQGVRTVYDKEAVCVESTNKKSRDEFRMRVRVIEQTFSAMHRYSKVLNPLRYGMYAFQMISHKLLRYVVPVSLITALLSNLALIGAAGHYRLAMLAQAAFYLTAAAGWGLDRAGLRIGPLAFPYYFALTAAATVVAFLKYMRGEAHITWEPLREASTPQAGVRGSQ